MPPKENAIQFNFHSAGSTMTWVHSKVILASMYSKIRYLSKHKLISTVNTNTKKILIGIYILKYSGFMTSVQYPKIASNQSMIIDTKFLCQYGLFESKYSKAIAMGIRIIMTVKIVFSPLMPPTLILSISCFEMG